MKIYSPLLRRNTECTLLKTLPTSMVRDAYQKEFDYDPSEEFKSIDNIQLMECSESKLRFFLPQTVAGRESLYKRLETFDWNYKEKKWEHDVALTLIEKGMHVLDVGCGRAAFLNRAKNDCEAIVTGLEFNESAAEYGQARGIEILTDTIQAHALHRPNTYDIVASFQVLEHVNDPASFVESCIAVLRPGGVLLLGVPNNDSFLGLLEDNWLNMPPHHMSLWSRSCLEGLTNYFQIDYSHTFVEPLQELGWFKTAFERRHLRGRLKSFVYYRFGFDSVFEGYIHDSRKSIPGHTIMTAFTKRNSSLEMAKAGIS